MMKKIIATLAALCASCFVISTSFAENVTIKIWALAERTGLARISNIEQAAEILNQQFKAANIDKKIIIEPNNRTAKGWDDLALDTMKAFSVNQGPDIYLVPHEWIGQFAQAGFAMDMGAEIGAKPWVYGDIIDNLWASTKADDGKIYGIPQDAEIRMFFYNKDMLRKIGKDEDFINNLPQMVKAGNFTLDDLTKLTKEVVDKKIAQYGMLHRPNVGIDYLMVFQSFGAQFIDEKNGKLLLPKQEIRNALAWYENNARLGVTPSDNTAMSWETIQANFKQERAFIFHQGVWAVAWQLGQGAGATWPNDEQGYFNKIGWIAAPAAQKGGHPVNLSHPILYAINPKGEHKQIAADLVALASLPYFNNQHAVSSYHIAISNAQTAMPAYKENWILSAASPLLADAHFVPNHTQFGSYNKILFSGLQAVETGKMTADQAIDFIAEELELQFGDDIEIVDGLNP